MIDSIGKLNSEGKASFGCFATFGELVLAIVSAYPSVNQRRDAA
jgi:hypothetical protein